MTLRSENPDVLRSISSAADRIRFDRSEELSPIQQEEIKTAAKAVLRFAEIVEELVDPQTEFHRLWKSFLDQGVSENDLTVVGKDQLAELEAQVDKDSQLLYDLSKENQKVRKENHDLRNNVLLVDGEKQLIKEEYEELEKWAYAIWMSFLAEEETHELKAVLQNFSSWMASKNQDSEEDETDGQ